MRQIALALLAALIATPVHATGGMTCQTAGARPIQVSVGLGHVPGSPLISTRLTDNGSTVPAKSAQWWLDSKELRLVLISPQADRQEVVIRTQRNGRTYDGNLWRGGKRHWVRCRES